MLTRLHSFISSSKLAPKVQSKTTVIGKRVLKAISFIVIFFLLEAQIAALLDPGRFKSNFHPRLRWEEFYRMNKNIDVVFLGSSHAYRSFDPFYFDRLLGVNSFNFGHSDQNPIDSYYVLNEVLQYDHPKEVVFELFFPLSEGTVTNSLNASYFLSASYVFDYIRPSWNKLDCLINDFQPQDYLKAVFRTIRDKDNYKNTKLIKTNSTRRWTEIKDQLSGKPIPFVQPTRTSTGELYKGKGFVVNDGVASQKQLTQTNRLKVYQDKTPDWDPKKLAYIQKIITLCKQKNIPLLLVTSPLPPSTMKFLSNNYQNIHDHYQQIADQNGVKYIDYNLINEQNQLFVDKNFKDEDHLNSAGVQIFDQDMLQYMKPMLKQ
ncbi:MAG: hypothetical protein JWN30_360 [Bacilli bacterium]|nr:hypothetical protein [Bacilli bacterium]